jgi:hypothetical protein
MSNEVGYWQNFLFSWAAGSRIFQTPSVIHQQGHQSPHHWSQLDTYNQAQPSPQLISQQPDQLPLLVRHFFLMERQLTSIKRSLALSDQTCTGSTSRWGQDNRRLWHTAWLPANVSSTKTAEETCGITYMMKTRSQRKRIFPRRLCSESHRYTAHSVISISKRNYIRVFGM